MRAMLKWETPMLTSIQKNLVRRGIFERRRDMGKHFSWLLETWDETRFCAGGLFTDAISFRVISSTLFVWAPVSSRLISIMLLYNDVGLSWTSVCFDVSVVLFWLSFCFGSLYWVIGFLWFGLISTSRFWFSMQLFSCEQCVWNCSHKFVLGHS